MEQPTPQPDPQATLFAKLARITGKIERVAKDGRNNHQGYDYATEGALVEAVREHLAAENVACLPSVVTVERVAGNESKGGTMFLTRVYMRFTFVCGDTGATFECPWVGEGQDTGDKGIYKAYTGALKYFLMKTFLIPTGDDPEHEQQAPRQQHQARPQPAPQGQRTINETQQPNRRQQMIARIVALAETYKTYDPAYHIPSGADLGAYNDTGLEDFGKRLKAAIEAKQVEIAEQQREAA